MFSNFKPINDNVLVELKPKEVTSAGGIIIPDQAQDKNQMAIVVHPGKSAQLNIGDTVFYKKYLGHALDETYLVLREEEILGVM
jgi:chaperonin GroES